LSVEQTLTLADGLYRTHCVTCGDRLFWELQPDADKPYWSTECCDTFYDLRVETVALDIQLGD